MGSFDRARQQQEWVDETRAQIAKKEPGSVLSDSELQAKYNIFGSSGKKRRGFANARAKELRDESARQTEQFESEMPGLKKDALGLLESGVDRSLDQGLKKTRENYSDRGLLFSGFRQGAEGSLRAQAGEQKARGRQEITKGFEDTLQAKKRATAHMGLQTYASALDTQVQTMNTQMQNSIQRRRMRGQLAAGLGAAAGIYAAQPGGGDISQSFIDNDADLSGNSTGQAYNFNDWQYS